MIPVTNKDEIHDIIYLSNSHYMEVKYCTFSTTRERQKCRTIYKRYIFNKIFRRQWFTPNIFSLVLDFYFY